MEVEELLDLFQTLRNKDKEEEEEVIKDPYRCHCGGTILITTECEACEDCGDTREIYSLLHEDVPFLDRNTYTPLNTKYSRVAHFKEWMSRAKCAGIEKIDTAILEGVRKECQGAATGEKVRAALKKLKKPMMYRHTNSIVSLLGGYVPSIPHQIEEIFIQMFGDVERAFEIHKPANRKNMLTYGFVIHKFCDLVGRPDLSTLFPTLKMGKKMMEQEVIWNKIAMSLNLM